MYKILFATATAWVFMQGGAVSARTFPNLTPNPAPFVTFANPGSSAPVDPPNDFLVVNTIQPALGSTALTTTGLLPLSAFASSTDLKATNALVASALTSVNSLSTSVTGLSAGLAALSSQVGTLQQFAIDARLEARRGVASAMAMSSASMPSAPGHTSWASTPPNSTVRPRLAAR